MSGWRPALRIARRDALRHKGRSTLVAVLVALPVLGASFADVIARTEQLDPQDVVAVKLLPTEQAQIQVALLGARVDQSPLDPDQWASDASALSDAPIPTFSFGGTPLVDGDGRAVTLLTGTVDPQLGAALSAGRAVVWDRNLLDAAGLIHVHLDSATDGAPGPVIALPATLVHSRPGLVTAVLPPSAASVLGTQVTPVGYLAQLSGTVDRDSLATVNARLARSGDWSASINPDLDSSLGATLLALVAAAMLVALVGTLTAVGLAQVEGRADSATLAAV